MIKKCPFCNNIITNNFHIHNCELNCNTPKKETKYLYIIHNFPSLNKETLTKEYVNENRSLPDLKKKYGIDYKSIIFLLDYYSIPKRSSSESARTIMLVKSKKTCLERYGVESSFSKGGISYNKRTIILKQKYNVENSFQIPEVIKRINDDTNWINYFGMTRKQKRSVESKSLWANKTPQEKEEWLNKSILSKSSRTHGSKETKPEKIIANILIELKISYEYQFRIDVSNKKRYFYDFYLNEIGVIVEINGDYWHANPSKYKYSDVLKTGHKEITALDIWEKDKKKLDFAKKNGFEVIVIWESEMIIETTGVKKLSFKNNEDIKKILYDKIKGVTK